MATEWKCPRCETDNPDARPTIVSNQKIDIKCTGCDFSFHQDLIGLIAIQNLFESWCRDTFSVILKDTFKKQENMAYADSAVASMFLAFSGACELRDKMWQKMWNRMGFRQ
jgi:hypothetical protein